MRGGGGGGGCKPGNSNAMIRAPLPTHSPQSRQRRAPRGAGEARRGERGVTSRAGQPRDPEGRGRRVAGSGRGRAKLARRRHPGRRARDSIAVYLQARCPPASSLLRAPTAPLPPAPASAQQQQPPVSERARAAGRALAASLPARRGGAVPPAPPRPAPGAPPLPAGVGLSLGGAWRAG